MSVVKEIIRSEADGSLSFGNFELTEKVRLQISHTVEILTR